MIANNVKFALKHGNEYPFDAPDAWWKNTQPHLNPPPPTDWAHTAARAIVGDLLDRRGLRQSLQDIDEEVRKELVESMRLIIFAALEEAPKTDDAFDKLNDDEKLALIKREMPGNYPDVPHKWVAWLLAHITFRQRWWRFWW